MFEDIIRREAEEVGEDGYHGVQPEEPDFAVEVRSMLFCIPITALARHNKVLSSGKRKRERRNFRKEKKRGGKRKKGEAGRKKKS